MRAPSRSHRDSTAVFYRPELDGLRFIAFLAVYMHHTVMFGVTGHHRRLPDAVARVFGVIGESGAFGVELFYALSAYLITELLLRERAARGAVDVPAFYMRRVLRIWPLYLLFLAVAYGLTFVEPSERLSAPQLLGFVLFSGNWAYMAHPVVTVAGPLWSVSVEEQFYLVWPWALRRASRRRVVLLALAIMAVGLAARCGLTLAGVVEPWISKNSLTRADGIAFGALLAAVLDGRSPELGRGVRAGLLAASLALLLVVAGAFHLFDGPFTVVRVSSGWWLAAAGSAGVLVSVLGATSGVGARLRSRPLVYLGRISYGLYVWHLLGLLIASRALPAFQTSPFHWAARIVLGLLITTALAAASYRWLESPFLRFKRRRFTLVDSSPKGSHVTPAALRLHASRCAASPPR